MNQIITYGKILTVLTLTCIHDVVLLNRLQAIPASRLINYILRNYRLLTKMQKRDENIYPTVILR